MNSHIHGMPPSISRCRICGNRDLDAVLDLGLQALTGIFPRDRESSIPKSPLELVKCRDDGSSQTCGLVQLRQSCQPDAMYGLDYGYRSGLNRSMVDHLRAKANNIQRTYSFEPGNLILDIGSNDGTLLRALDAPGLCLAGMDPTGAKFRQYYPPHIHLVSDFFSAGRFQKEFGNKCARLVTSIAMFYDLEDPLEFAQQVYDVLSWDGIWVFEQSYLPSMLEKNAYDTICHEHVQYFALKQILWMLHRVGFTILDVEVNDVNGGSFSVTAAKHGAGYNRNDVAIHQLICREEQIGLRGDEIYSSFRDRVFQHRHDLKTFLREATGKGEKIFGYGASTKGNVLLQFCDITAEELTCIAEVNSDKFGAFTPGTGIPIVSEEEARSMKPDAFLVLPWHFRDGIIDRERQYLASGGKLIFPLPEIEVVRN